MRSDEVWIDRLVGPSPIDSDTSFRPGAKHELMHTYIHTSIHWGRNYLPKGEIMLSYSQIGWKEVWRPIIKKTPCLAGLLR